MATKRGPTNWHCPIDSTGEEKFEPVIQPTLKQAAYARRVFNANGTSRSQIARDVGYSPSSAINANHIEKSQGFKTAMIKLSIESGDIASAIMTEFKRRGVTDFSDKDLIGALNAISSAWSKFNSPLLHNSENDTPNTSRLRTVILQQIEQQNITNQNGETTSNP
jgi:hypothetical protein